ncbi:hypothetical protein [Pelagibius marinus]|uniref:hypothetical protein n=1 Tax=Pelagibius marinus TaxID=2762760 RepID=UPI0018722149|nr:hypothetical protein [Pelagibius marinus]
MLPQNRRFPSLRPSLATAALAAAVLLPGAAQADWKKATITNLVTKQIVVLSNGSEYTQVPAPSSLIADVRVEADAELSGEIKEWKTWLSMRRENGAVLEFSNFAHHKSYPWSEHIKSVDRTVQLAVPQSAWQLAVIDSCNRLADEFRADGQTDAQIFGQNQTISYDLEARLEVEASGPNEAEGLFQLGHELQQLLPPFLEEVEVVCQKWSPTVPQTAGALTVQQPEVVNLGLSIVEKATVNGACKIRLDGWVTTDLKNADVDIQFENDEGKKSPVKTVNTGDSKTATFSRWEDVPNHPQGQVRIVGDGFQSDWVDYDLDCVEGGPGGIAANLPPKLTMSVVPHGEVMVQGRICPETVKLVGVVWGQGDATGQALFFGPGYVSPLRDYSVGHGEKALIGAEAELDWSDVPAPPVPNALFGQVREFGFNATNEDGAVIAMLPKQPHFIQCKLPAVNQRMQSGIGGLKGESLGPQHSGAATLPAVQARPGGMTTGTRDAQQSGATAVPRLRALPQLMTPEAPESTRPQRLRRLRRN